MIIILATTELEFKIKKNKHIDIKLLLLDHMEKKKKHYLSLGCWQAGKSNLIF
jgi:hypothetical protein